ncbi:Sir2 silent information regulator family NAD-dependent deacetylase [Actinomyces viscosus]|uniref:Deacetylase sirtuin-type domain-containing protein n=1 Tax=Actinomyces viscosus TaxID=1656 RepID=A0A3S4YZJ3_ACTVI|nr:Sir2 silent information regulator family NAD-dependent deacetylase [Actinomyces viscosus]TFH53112.1 Sir2 silent information regulator family NAD-dependent deacetylase [Actinomyces viscosus]VEI14221.1 Uncharacterised protein [Actinomyces viscosus]
MSSTRPTNRSTAASWAPTAERSEAIRHLADAAERADAVVVGAGSGLSTAAGLTYSGPRFQRLFPDFIDAFGLTDMYSSGFYPFPTPEHRWAYWSRHIMADRYSEPVLPLYQDLREILDGLGSTDYFVITTNVDHAFARNGFDESRLFATQGDYGLWQCSVPCHDGTWSNESAVREMAARQRDLRIPSSLLPVCPRCGEPAAMNLRVDATFVEDSHWHAAAERYRRFLSRHETGRVLYLEIGVGWNTPSLIKFPFWQRTYANASVTFATLNLETEIPRQIAERSIAVSGDIAASIETWKALTQS